MLPSFASLLNKSLSFNSIIAPFSWLGCTKAFTKGMVFLGSWPWCFLKYAAVICICICKANYLNEHLWMFKFLMLWRTLWPPPPHSPYFAIWTLHQGALTKYEYFPLSSHTMWMSFHRKTILYRYTKEKDVSRARGLFFTGEVPFMLYTERTHFYHRYACYFLYWIFPKFSPEHSNQGCYVWLLYLPLMS